MKDLIKSKYIRISLYLVLTIFIAYWVLPFIIVFSAKGLANVLPDSIIWENKITSEYLGHLVPKNKTHLCSIAQNIWINKNEHKIYIYKFKTNNKHEELDKYYRNPNITAGMYGDSAMVYGDDYSYIVYAQTYTPNAKPGFNMINNEAIESRISYGFEEIDLNKLCELIQNSNSTEDWSETLKNLR